MPCNTCRHVDPIEPHKHGLQYSFAQHVTTVEGKDGRFYKLFEPLIPRPHRPRGGWSAVVVIHGQKSTITGMTAGEVFVNAERLLSLNEVLYTRPQLWLNLNIQWVERAIEKYQKVRLESLLAISIPNY